LASGGGNGIREQEENDVAVWELVERYHIGDMGSSALGRDTFEQEAFLKTMS